MAASRLGSALIFCAAAGVTGAFILNFCNLVYRCGCQSWWRAASANCNIHVAGVKHCPWCSIGRGGFALVLVLILGAQFAVSLWRRDMPWPLRLALAALAFPLAGTLAALAAGWWTGYWST